MEDPIRTGIKSYITFAWFVENGVEKMRLRNRITANTNYLDNPNYDEPDVQNVPEGCIHLLNNNNGKYKITKPRLHYANEVLDVGQSRSLN